MNREASGRVAPHVIAATITAVGAMMLYMLLLRDAVLVQLARQLCADSFEQYVLVAVVGIAGAAGCVAAAAVPVAARQPWALAGGFAVCAAAMLGALGVDSWVRLLGFTAVAAFAAGWVMVALSLVLRGAVGSDRLGLCIGFGVGTAFAIFSVPQVFAASVAVHALLAAGAAALGLIAAFGLRSKFATTSFSPDYQPRVWLTWIVVLLVLVWMDKAALFMIRGAAAREAFQWGGWWSQWSTACLHFLIAALAGAAFDRGWASGMLLFAVVLLLAACTLSHAETQAYAAAEIFYALGASIYATALVFYPARGGRPWLAAGLLACTRWAGGSLGVAIVLALGDVPAGLLLGVALLAVGAIWLRAHWRERERWE